MDPEVEQSFNEFVAENFASVSKSIRKESRSVRNRIQSIFCDAAFVKEVTGAYELPLVANERCGRWYIDPSEIAESVYFKSTDGHTGQWGFSFRRLNTHLLDTIARGGGVIIVDSTRRGKRMPDALSKTVPIWCAVLNKALLGLDLFYTPPNAVSASERSQIEELLPLWVSQLKSMELNLDALRNKLNNKPIRPIWVTPDSYLPESPPTFDEFFPIVLCTASRMVQDGTEFRQGFCYVQGAADDHEEWAELLTPEILWNNQHELKQTHYSDKELYELISQMHVNSISNDAMIQKTDSTRIEPTNLWIGKTGNTDDTSFDIRIDLSEQAPEEYGENAIVQRLHAGKKGSKDLRTSLPNIISRYEKLHSPDKQVLITCDSGSDFSVGVALVLFCIYYTKDGECRPTKTSQYMDKDSIRQRLAFIVTQRKVNPSRATLNSANAYLMG
jgi:tRNA A64-2'-O-ribosylphosphate transferase